MAIRNCVQFLVWVVCVATAPALAAGTRAAALNAVIAHHCEADVLFLGEDSGHGSGAAIAFKTALVPRLVAECGYDTLVFESGLYEFLALPPAPSEAQLADAIGGLWSTTAELDPLLAYLVAAIPTQGLNVHGMDPQLGSATQGWTQQQLAASVVATLPARRRRDCQAELERFLRWQFDAAHPYDRATEQRLAACGDAILVAAGLHPNAALSRDASSVAVARRRLVDGLQMARADGGPKGLRAQRMAEHLRWLVGRNQGARPRMIVWTSNAHAAGTPATTVAARLAGDTGLNIHRLLFDAAGGTRGRAGGPVRAVTAGSPETVAAGLPADADTELAYVAPPAVDGDAYVVFRADRPPTFVHPARPRYRGPTQPLPIGEH